MGTNHTTKNRALEETLKQKGLFSSTSAPWQQEILEKLLNKTNLSTYPNLCLDAACGIGNNIETLLNHCHKIITFDKSAKAIEFAKGMYNKDKGAQIEFSINSLETMPYDANSFDCVVCTEALEHVVNPDIIIQEIFRVTKPGGYAIISFQNHFNPSTFLKFIFEIIFRKNWDVWGTHRHDEGYENYLTCFRVKKYTKKAGFVSIKEIGTDYINAWFSWMPFVYKNYKILDRYPLLLFGKMPILKYLGMDYFMLLKKP